MMDNYDMWRQHDMEQSRRLERLPVCSYCGEPIQQEDAVCIDGEWFCDDCLETHFRQAVEYEID